MFISKRRNDAVILFQSTQNHLCPNVKLYCLIIGYQLHHSVGHSDPDNCNITK